VEIDISTEIMIGPGYVSNEFNDRDIQLLEKRYKLQHAKISKNRKNATGVTNTVSIVNENKIVKCNITTEL